MDISAATSRAMAIIWAIEDDRVFLELTDALATLRP